jgi:DeoR family transcriptional regulator, galactitol utilization operon repressor
MIANLSEREKKILELLSEDTNKSVAEISDLLKVSRVTVRSDFTSLEEKGLIIRTRGGAFPAFHPEILDRQKQGVEEKKRIARAAATLIEDGDTVMINDGTTTSLIPKYLLGKRDVRIVTNSTLIIPFARVNPSLNLTLVGGEFRPSSEAIVGPVALRDLENFHVRLSFLGTGGFSIENGLTTHLVEGSEILRKMTELSEKRVLVADSGKYGRNGFVRIVPMDRIDILITDEELDGEVRKAIEDRGIEVIIC